MGTGTARARTRPFDRCQHSRANTTEQGRSQGYWNVTTNCRRRGGSLSIFRRFTIGQQTLAADGMRSTRAKYDRVLPRLGDVARRWGGGFHSTRHRHLPTRQTIASGPTTRETSASDITVVTDWGKVDDFLWEPSTVMLESSRARCAADLENLGSFLTRRSSISHRRQDFEGVLARNTTKLRSPSRQDIYIRIHTWK